LTKVLIIGGATLLAPVFEEFLFRGHLQTVLLRAFTPSSRRRQVPDTMIAPMAVGTPSVEVVPAPAPLPPPLEPEAPRVASAGARWAAIAITSLVFAALHPFWTWPLIFLLSLALGYVYERTGNLWAAVTMHLTFNTTQTAFFLIFRSL
jgi:membrane protease YdiL (CAAX protease family)